MTNIKHVTEHDGSRWVEYEVVEPMIAILKEIMENHLNNAETCRLDNNLHMHESYCEAAQEIQDILDNLKEDK